jgi:hypothetical protein
MPAAGEKSAVLVSLFMAVAAAALPARCAPAAGLADSGLDAGYQRLYNLEFNRAHEVFRDWGRLHPQDPLAPASEAAAYLFSELDRLHVLQSELFVDDEKFEHRKKLAPDEHVQAAFQTALEQAESLSRRILAQSPGDANALFADVLAFGLRADYTALIEKRNFASLRYMKSGRMLAERLLNLHPSYYDAYLAIGVENYIFSLRPAPVRWLLRAGGAETDKREGIEKLKLTAEKGHYLQPYARLLLAVSALRDKDFARTQELLAGLAREFPRNPLYRRELDRLRLKTAGTISSSANSIASQNR